MVLQLFKRKTEEKPPRILDKGDSVAVRQALMEGLNEMERQHVDRIVLTMYESEPNPNVRGRWINVGKETRYYPFEMLDEAEQTMINEGKTYTVISLVRDNVGNVISYSDRGIEKFHRTHLVPMLPPLVPESQLNYVTEGFLSNDLEQIAKDAVKSGWTPEAIRQRVQEGIQEYKGITRKLMEKAGVYDALERMEKRGNLI